MVPKKERDICLLCNMKKVDDIWHGLYECTNETMMIGRKIIDEEMNHLIGKMGKCRRKVRNAYPNPRWRGKYMESTKKPKI
jgi:hypothetical protein